MSAAATVDSLFQPRGVSREVLLQAAKALLLSLLPHRGSKQHSAFASYAAMAAAVPKGNWFDGGDASGGDGDAMAAAGSAAAPGEHCYEYVVAMRRHIKCAHSAVVASVNRAAAALESRAGVYTVVGERCAVVGACRVCSWPLVVRAARVLWCGITRNTHMFRQPASTTQSPGGEADWLGTPFQMPSFQMPSPCTSDCTRSQVKPLNFRSDSSAEGTSEGVRPGVGGRQGGSATSEGEDGGSRR